MPKVKFVLPNNEVVEKDVPETMSLKAALQSLPQLGSLEYQVRLEGNGQYETVEPGVWTSFYAREGDKFVVTPNIEGGV